MLICQYLLIFLYFMAFIVFGNLHNCDVTYRVRVMYVILVSL